MSKRLLSLLDGIEYSCPKNIDSIFISAVCCDSRKAKSGSVFVAIKGAEFDGHDFVYSSYVQGCRVFVAEKELNLPSDAVIIITENSRYALALISSAFYCHPSEKMRVIGITGTKGKTTSAYFIKQMLETAGKKAGYIGTNGVIYGNVREETHNTTPESCELQSVLSDMVAAGIEYAVIEVSSQALYMSRVRGIAFDSVIFTNLSPDHIGGFEHPDFEHYKKCKKSLFFEYGAKTVIYNADDRFASEMIPAGILPVSVSLKDPDADFYARDISFENTGSALGSHFSLCAVSGAYEVTLPAPGIFSVYNALIATAAARCYGVGFPDIIKALNIAHADGRFEFIRNSGGRIFVVDYAHNGISLRSVLTALRGYNPSRLICLFGSVGERTQLRRKDLGDAAAELADYTIITSDNPDFEPPEDIMRDIAASFGSDTSKYKCIADRKEAVLFAVEHSMPGDTVLFAGKGCETYQLIRGIRQPYSERAEIIRALACLEKQNK